MDVTQIPKGRSAERHTDNRPLSEPGIYRHRDTGAEFITAPGEEGVLQADALMAPLWKDAWEKVGEVPSRQELLQRQKLRLAKDLASEKVAKEQDDKELATLVDAEKATLHETEPKAAVSETKAK